MGEDFILKTEKSYRRSVQKVMHDRLSTPPLLAGSEVKTTTYPCRTLKTGMALGTRLHLHRCGDGTLEAVEGHHVVGRVEGEPSLDLLEVFDAHPGCAGMLVIDITSEDSDGHFEFEVVEGQ